MNDIFSSKEEFLSELYRIFGLNSLSDLLDADKAGRFCELASALVSANEEFNLTAVTDARGIILKHFADSLPAAKHLPLGASVIDVGCGGGFPTFPLAICRPDLRITALDSTEKKIAYVARTADALGLSNVTAIYGRAEELSRGSLREGFDAAVARAVAPYAVLCELCLPFVKVGGVFVALKATRADEELDAEKKFGIARKCGGGEMRRIPFSLTDGEEVLTRVLLEVKKSSPTPDTYPRNYSQIAKMAKSKK